MRSKKGNLLLAFNNQVSGEVAYIARVILHAAILCSSEENQRNGSDNKVNFVFFLSCTSQGSSEASPIEIRVRKWNWTSERINESSIASRSLYRNRIEYRRRRSRQFSALTWQKEIHLLSLFQVVPWACMTSFSIHKSLAVSTVTLINRPPIIDWILLAEASYSRGLASSPGRYCYKGCSASFPSDTRARPLNLRFVGYYQKTILN